MRRYSRRGNAQRPRRAWQDISTTFALTAAAADTAVALLQFEAPAAGTLTAMPPEDITILRVVGDFTAQLSAAASQWTLGMLVADGTWTPGASFSADSDKRILWVQNYSNIGGTATQTWYPPGMFLDGAGTPFPGTREASHVDITPKVRLEQGKALFLVGWENTGAGTMTVTSVAMRVLYQKSGRR